LTQHDFVLSRTWHGDDRDARTMVCWVDVWICVIVMVRAAFHKVWKWLSRFNWFLHCLFFQLLESNLSAGGHCQLKQGLSRVDAQSVHGCRDNLVTIICFSQADLWGGSLTVAVFQIFRRCAWQLAFLCLCHHDVCAFSFEHMLHKAQCVQNCSRAFVVTWFLMLLVSILTKWQTVGDQHLLSQVTKTSQSQQWDLVCKLWPFNHFNKKNDDLWQSVIQKSNLKTLFCKNDVFLAKMGFGFAKSKLRHVCHHKLVDFWRDWNDVAFCTWRDVMCWQCVFSQFCFVWLCVSQLNSHSCVLTQSNRHSFFCPAVACCMLRFFWIAHFQWRTKKVCFRTFCSIVDSVTWFWGCHLLCRFNFFLLLFWIWWNQMCCRTCVDTCMVILLISSLIESRSVNVMICLVAGPAFGHFRALWVDFVQLQIIQLISSSSFLLSQWIFSWCCLQCAQCRCVEDAWPHSNWWLRAVELLHTSFETGMSHVRKFRPLQKSWCLSLDCFEHKQMTRNNFRLFKTFWQSPDPKFAMQLRPLDPIQNWTALTVLMANMWPESSTVTVQFTSSWAFNLSDC